MAEPNLFDEVAADLDRQRLQNLWNRYGLLAIAAAVVVVLGTGVISAWQSWHTEKNQRVTGELIDIVRHDDTDTAKQIAALTAFAAKNLAMAQAAIASLQAAALEVKQGHIDKAIELYRDMQTHGKDPHMVPFAEFATLMSVKLRMDSEDPVQLARSLDVIAQDSSPWRYTAREYQGYLALKAGDKAKAKTLFTDLSQGADVPASLSERATVILRHIGG